MLMRQYSHQIHLHKNNQSHPKYLNIVSIINSPFFCFHLTKYSLKLFSVFPVNYKKHHWVKNHP